MILERAVEPHNEVEGRVRQALGTTPRSYYLTIRIGGIQRPSLYIVHA